MIGNIFKQSYQSSYKNRSSYYITKIEINYNFKKSIHQIKFSHNSGYITINQFLRLKNLSYFYDSVCYFKDVKSWKRRGLDLIMIPTYPISYSFSNAISNESIVITRYIILFQRKIRKLIRRRKNKELRFLQLSLLRNCIDIPSDIIKTIYIYL